MIDEQTVKVRGCEGALGYTSKGSEQIAVDLMLLEGPNAGAHITWYGYFTELTFERTVESLRLLGWKGSDFSDLTGITEQEAQAVIEHEPDQQGEIRARVKWINGVGGVALKERMDVGAAKAFAQRMRGKVLALSGQQQQRGTSPAQQRPTAASEQRMTPAQRAAADQLMTPAASQPAAGDDIPF